MNPIPKEKAKEIFSKMHNQIQTDELGTDQESAKRCALIAVDEIIKATIPLSSTYYYQEVKQEIIKL